MKHLKKLILPIVLFFLSAIIQPALATATYGTGYYTNLCGSQTAATTDTCNKGCDPTNGTCTDPALHVIKYICDGRVTTCHNNHSDFATTQNVADVTCGKTVEVDVYKKTCQTMFGWFCNDSDLIDYMTWYSGDCAGAPSSAYQPPAVTTPAPTGICTSLTVVSGNNTIIPANVTLKASGSDSAGTITGYRYYFGDGNQIQTTSPQVTHQYQASGSFFARAYIEDGRGNWVTSPACETAVSVTGFPLETQKSSCANLFLLSPNNIQAPVTMSFEITGYDNKGPIKQYKMDYGNGTVVATTTNSFTYTYPTAGTFLARGYILNSQNVWQTASGTCEQAIYATTHPLTRQPNTGAPTWFTILGIVSGAIGASVLLAQGLSATPVTHARGKHRRVR